VLGSLFMPFMALTELFLLNMKNFPAEWRNNWWLNTILGIVTGLFVILGIYQVWKAVAPYIGG